MTAPVRLQLSRKKGFDLRRASREANGLDVVNVARPSRWGNPFVAASDAHDFQSKVITGPSTFVLLDSPWDASGVVEMYRQWLAEEPVADPIDGATLEGPYMPEPPYLSLIWKLRGRNLACWCPLDAPCHADVLLELANGGRPAPQAGDAVAAPIPQPSRGPASSGENS